MESTRTKNDVIDLTPIVAAFEEQWIHAHGLSQVQGRAVLGGSVPTARRRTRCPSGTGPGKGS